MKQGIPSGQIVQNMRGALSGLPVGVLHQPSTVNQVGIMLQLPEEQKSNINEVMSLNVVSPRGTTTQIGNLVSVKEREKAKSIYRKNQKRVVYVLAEVAGELESPVYAMMDASKQLAKIKLPEG